MGTDLARWQFATTSFYHFLFVPVTVGLAFLVALTTVCSDPPSGPDHDPSNPVTLR